MTITKNPTEVVITLSPKEYWLRKNTNDPEFLGEYVLTHRIDMSYKGKEDQEGGVFMYLSEEMAKTFKDAGFDEIIN